MQVLYQLSYLQVLQWLQLFASPQEAYEGLPPSPPTSSRALPQFPHHSLSDQGRWSPSMEKTCLSLMTKNVGHFFCSLLSAIWISLVKCLPSSFVRLLIRGFALSVLNFMILHISYASSGVQLVNFFLHSVCCVFTLLFPLSYRSVLNSRNPVCQVLLILLELLIPTLPLESSCLCLDHDGTSLFSLVVSKFRVLHSVRTQIHSEWFLSFFFNKTRDVYVVSFYIQISSFPSNIC